MIPALQGMTVSQWTVLGNVLWYLTVGCLAAGVCSWAAGKARRAGEPNSTKLTPVQLQTVCGILGLMWPLLLGFGVVLGARRLLRGTTA